MYCIKSAGIPIIGFKHPLKLVGDKQTIQDLGGFHSLSPNTNKLGPTGFWEVDSISTQIGLQERHDDYGCDGDVVKIMNQIITKSNKDMIDKVVVIIRNPLNVLSSLGKINRTLDNEKELNYYASHFTYHSLSSLKWMQDNEIDFLFVLYEDLVSTPLNVMNDVCNFLGKGDYLKGAKGMRLHCNRSKEIELKSEYIDRAVDCYAHLARLDTSILSKYDLDELRDIKDGFKQIREETGEPMIA